MTAMNPRVTITLMVNAPKFSGRFANLSITTPFCAGYAPNSLSRAALVSGPYSPSAVMPTCIWNALTAAVVFGPKKPSTSSANPRPTRARWTPLSVDRSNDTGSLLGGAPWSPACEHGRGGSIGAGDGDAVEAGSPLASEKIRDHSRSPGSQCESGAGQSPWPYQPAILPNLPSARCGSLARAMPKTPSAHGREGGIPYSFLHSAIRAAIAAEVSLSSSHGLSFE